MVWWVGPVSDHAPPPPEAPPPGVQPSPLPQVEELQSENAVLRAQLQQRGLEGGGPEGLPQ